MQTQAIGSAGVICAQCAVCQERFGNSSVISVLFCGHAFHQSCLNRWIASSSSCPQCRQPVRADRHVQRVYFDFCEFSESAQRELDAEQLVVERGQLRDELRSVRNDLKNAHEYAAELTNQLDKERRENRTERTKRQQVEADFAEQRKQVAVLREFKAEASRLRSEIEQYEAIKTILRGTESEFELLATQFGLRSRTDETSRSILNWLIVLRGELSTLRSEQSRMLKELANERRAREDADTLRRNNATLTERCTSLKSRIEEMKREHRVEVERIRSIARKLMRARGEKSSTAAAVSNVSKSSDSSCVSDAIRLCVESPAPRSLITPLASRHAAENDSLVDLVDDDDDLLESLSAKQRPSSSIDLDQSVILLDQNNNKARSVREAQRSAPAASAESKSGFSTLLNALKRSEQFEEPKQNRFAAASSNGNMRELLKRSASRNDEQVVYDGFGNAKRTLTSSSSGSFNPSKSHDAPLKRPKDDSLVNKDDVRKPKQGAKAISDKNVLLNYLTVKPK